jgi:hypothetical protein
MRFHPMSSAGVLIASVFGLGVVNGIANATPLSTPTAAFKATATDSGFIELVHGCNQVCMRGPVPEWSGVVRWHRHVGKFCRPIECTPYGSPAR